MEMYLYKEFIGSIYPKGTSVGEHAGQSKTADRPSCFFNEYLTWATKKACKWWDFYWEYLEHFNGCWKSDNSTSLSWWEWSFESRSVVGQTWIEKRKIGWFCFATIYWPGKMTDILWLIRLVDFALRLRCEKIRVESHSNFVPPIEFGYFIH